MINLMWCHVFAIVSFATATNPVSAQADVVLEFDGGNYRLNVGVGAGFTRFMVVDAVSIHAVATSGRIILEIALPLRAQRGDQPHDARILFQPDGWRNYWSSAPEFPAGGLVVTALDLSGPAPRITGHFSVPLCFTKSPMHTPNLAQCKPATGRFDTVLNPS